MTSKTWETGAAGHANTQEPSVPVDAIPQQEDTTVAYQAKKKDVPKNMQDGQTDA